MTTKLDAVNDVMRRLGKLPITALDTGGDATQGQVERIIDDSAKRVMRDGWAWNTKYDVEVTPDVSTNKVQINQLEPVGDGSYYEIYHVDTYGESKYINVMRSGNFLYDLDENQDTFGDYSKLKLKYVYERAFTEIPPQFVDWIVSVSAYNYNRQFVKDNDLDQALAIEMSKSKVSAMREELRADDTNVLGTAEMKQIRGRPRMQNRSIH